MRKTCIDLFSGIGGFAMAAEQVGWETVLFCEIDPFCQAVLKTHFEGVPIVKDVRQLTAESIRQLGITEQPFMLTAGFPCQPFSAAGQRRGDTDDRFLWPETVRVVDELRPEFAVFENVAGLLSMVESDTLSELEIEALQLFHEDIDTPITKTVERIHRRIIGRIIGDLEAIGYSPLRMPDGTPVILCLPACAVGAWHRRDRLWIVAFDTKHNGRSSSQRRGSVDASAREQSSGAENALDAAGTAILRRHDATNGSKPGLQIAGQNGVGQFQTETGTRIHDRPEQHDSESIADGHDAGIGAPGRGTDAFRPPEGVERRDSLGEPGGHDQITADGSRILAGRQEQRTVGERTRESGQSGSRFELFDHWLEAAGELCRVVHGLPEELDAADVQALEQAVKCLGREEAERAVGFDLGEIENRVWRTERLKALGNTIYPEVVLQVFGVIEALKKG